jgi:hypothetical protein
MAAIRLPVLVQWSARLDRATVAALDRIRAEMDSAPSRSSLIADILTETVKAGKFPARPASWNGHKPPRKLLIGMSLPPAILTGLDRICASVRPRPTRGCVVSTALATWCEKHDH